MSFQLSLSVSRRALSRIMIWMILIVIYMASWPSTSEFPKKKTNLPKKKTNLPKKTPKKAKT